MQNSKTWKGGRKEKKEQLPSVNLINIHNFNEAEIPVTSPRCAGRFTGNVQAAYSGIQGTFVTTVGGVYFRVWFCFFLMKCIFMGEHITWAHLVFHEWTIHEKTSVHCVGEHKSVSLTVTTQGQQQKVRLVWPKLESLRWCSPPHLLFTASPMSCPSSSPLLHQGGRLFFCAGWH